MSVGKPQEKRLFGRPLHRWQDDIKMDDKYNRDLIPVAQGREQLWAAGRIVMNFRYL
jgi:hypothetical protein